MRAKKSLGQHFLTSEDIASSIVDIAGAAAGETIVEIGPGRGMLTDKLLSREGKLIVIEKDNALIPFLQKKYAEEINAGSFEVLHADALEFDPDTLRTYGRTYGIVANIPYYITGALLKKFLTAEYQPEKIVFLVQKEVAERIVAKDGKESILSLSVKAYGTPEYRFTVSKEHFDPEPSVDSAVLSIENISRGFFETNRIDEAVFFEIIRKAFSQKRKTLLNTLFSDDKEGGREILKKLALSETARAESLTLENWRDLICLIQ